MFKVGQNKVSKLVNIASLSRCFSTTYPSKVRIVEVGPRDGLQNEKNLIPTQVKVNLIDMLSDTGLTHIEATSFVAAKFVPQMGDHAQVMAGINRKAGVTYPVLVPNVRGLQGALKSEATEVAIFAAASEEFSQANLNCSIAKSFERFNDLMAMVKEQPNVKVRGYVSCVLGCPYGGDIHPDMVSKVTEQLFNLGCYEVSLGDTIGVGTPGSTSRLLRTLNTRFDVNTLACHFHDTYGQSLSNILVALEEGVSVFDSSVSGLGGCPFAKGATGNVATEDLVYMLNGMGIETGVDLDKLIDAGDYISKELARPNNSRVANAILAKRKSKSVETEEKRASSMA